MTVQRSQRVVILPCSGIGKSYGTVAREAAYDLVEDLRPDQTELVALALLVLGDEAAQAKVAQSPVVAIDGCKLACAAKLAKECGAKELKEVSVLDAFRRHRDLKPQGIAELNEEGRALARAMAAEIAAGVNTMLGGGEK